MHANSGIDFYVLGEPSKQQAWLFACHLIEKTYQQQPIYVHTNSRAEAEQFDNLLWTYRDDSFLPHCIFEQDCKDKQHAHPGPPIQIGYGETPTNLQGILINFHRDIPAFYSLFTRVIEIVFADPSVQQLARERFRQYRNQGCAMNTHKV